MKKALTYGAIFGLVTGLIVLLTYSTSTTNFIILSNIIFFIVYLVAQVFIMRDASKEGKGYGARFLRGWVFSLMIGVIYGILEGVAQLSFPQVTQQALDQLNSAFRDAGLQTQIDTAAAAPNAFTLVWSVLAGILFNAVFGAFWSAIFAAIFRPEQE